MANNLRWLHLSDLHFKRGPNVDRDAVLEALLKSLPGLFERSGKPHVIVISGDIAFSGHDREYENATDFLDRLLSISGVTKVNLIVVPGNHDIERHQGRGLSRTLTSREESDQYFDPTEPLLHIEKRLGAFKKWHDNFFVGIREFSTHSTCQPVIQMECSAGRLAILAINTAAFCYDEHDEGKLWLGRTCVSQATKTLTGITNALRMVVMHHPIDWLSEIEKANVKGYIRDAADVILTGHLHRTDVESVAGIIGQSVHLMAGAAYQKRRWPNSAMLCSVKAAELSVMPLRYEDTPSEVWTVDTSIYPSSPEYCGTYTISRMQIVPEEFSPTSLFEMKQAVASPSNTKAQIAVAEFKSDLFVTSSGIPLYAEPRLMTKPQEFAWQNDGTYIRA